MTDRAAALSAMLAHAGWDGASRAPLHGDASFRRYERLHGAEGATAILMDAPPPQENVRPFVDVAERLRAAGLSAPVILAQDVEQGFLLLEDFGDARVGELLRRGDAPEPLYALATDTLAALHGAATSLENLPGWRRPELIRTASLFLDWWMPHAGRLEVSDAMRASFLEAWNAVFDVGPSLPQTMVLRDYFPDNLMLLAGRPGVQACGLLDFQDAGIGSPAYDLVSLLRDARRDVPAGIEAAMIARYLAARPEIDRAAFLADYALHGAQRACRILGVFVRLDRRDGKPHYLNHLPRLWRQLDMALAAPLLAPVADWFTRQVPAEVRSGR